MVFNYKNYQQCVETGVILTDEALIKLAIEEMPSTPIKEDCCKVLRHPEYFSDFEKFLARVYRTYAALVQVKFTNKHGRLDVYEVVIDPCGKAWESR